MSGETDERPADQPSAAALRYAHEVRWPNDRIDLARLCEQYAAIGGVTKARQRDDANLTLVERGDADLALAP